MSTQTSKTERKTQAIHFVKGKYCSRCGRYYPYKFFIRNNSTRDGYRRACCFCNAATLKTKNLRAEAWKEIEGLQTKYNAEYIKFMSLDEAGEQQIDVDPNSMSVGPAVTYSNSRIQGRINDIVPEPTIHLAPYEEKTPFPNDGPHSPLAFLSDDALIEELRKRGYTGTIEIKRTVAVAI